MSLTKLWVLAITPLLYLWHYGISWFLYKSSSKRIYEDSRKFGSELAFVAITFWVAALIDTTSRLHTILKTEPSETIVGISISSILIVLLFDAIAVFFYKTYEEKNRKNIKQYWRLFISYVAGLVVLGAGVLMI
ncbi:MAG: hypothetical protein C4557_04385 [Anaerolineaceae bacterium]|jgi:cytochrome bd-type quinol oxidase subunit 2|nr:MAG: hypothetical protein C4557_04385 [Anaerolineaceae bacterium]